MRTAFRGLFLLVLATGVMAQTDSGPEQEEADRAEADFEVTEKFGKIDRNNDGLINLWELGRAVGRGTGGWFSDSDADRGRRANAGAGKGRSTLAEVFVRSDSDGDGSLNQVEYERYRQGLRQGNVDMPAVVPNIFEKRF